MLKQYSAKELQQELARRETEQKLKSSKPKILDVPQLSELSDLCVKYVDAVDAGEVDDDLKHYIFEAAMTGFFGKPVWPWINSRMR